MPSGAEVLSDGAICRKEPLGVPCRLKSVHPPFPLAGVHTTFVQKLSLTYYTHN